MFNLKPMILILFMCLRSFGIKVVIEIFILFGIRSKSSHAFILEYDCARQLLASSIGGPLKKEILINIFQHFSALRTGPYLRFLLPKDETILLLIWSLASSLSANSRPWSPSSLWRFTTEAMYDSLVHFVLTFQSSFSEL